jgi:hypothetical protein
MALSNIADTSGGQRSKTIYGYSIDFGNTADGAVTASADIDISGGGFIAHAGDFVQVSRSDGAAWADAGTHVTGRVKGEDLLVLEFRNYSGGAVNPAAVNVDVRIISKNPT